MNKVHIEFDTGNAAFGYGNGPEEVARILQEVSTRIRFREETMGAIYDTNGNRVGSWQASFSHAITMPEGDQS